MAAVIVVWKVLDVMQMRLCMTPQAIDGTFDKRILGMSPTTATIQTLELPWPALKCSPDHHPPLLLHSSFNVVHE